MPSNRRARRPKRYRFMFNRLTLRDLADMYSGGFDRQLAAIHRITAGGAYDLPPAELPNLIAQFTEAGRVYFEAMGQTWAMAQAAQLADQANQGPADPAADETTRRLLGLIAGGPGLGAPKTRAPKGAHYDRVWATDASRPGPRDMGCTSAA